MRLAPAGQVVLGGSFRVISRGVAETFASGDYLVADGRAPIVINDALGTTAALNKDPGCDVVGLAPPSVVMSCLQTAVPYVPSYFEFYSLVDGTRQTVTPTPPLPCVQGQVVCNVAAVGSYWIEWRTGFYHIPTNFYFQNTQTGELLDDPSNATTFPDLNSPSLAETTCPGVRLIYSNFPSPDNYANPWGPLTYASQFALATIHRVIGGAYTDQVVLERCGTHMRRLLGDGSNMVSNASVIVWQTAPNRLSGLFLPSLQKFTMPLPSAVVAAEEAGGETGLALTSEALYMNEAGGRLWRTTSPAGLPRNVSGPRVTHSGSTLTCVRGSWLNAAKFSYEWQVSGRKEKATESRLVLAMSPNRRSVNCSVIASNPAGTTTASSAPLQLP
jgi:hypothetical protein